MFSSTKRAAVTVFVACGVSILGLGTAGLIASSSPAVATAGTCAAPSRSADKATGPSRANPAPTSQAEESPVIGTDAPAQGDGDPAQSGAPVVGTTTPVQAPNPTTGSGDSPWVSTNAPVNSTGSAPSGSLVDTNAPVQVHGVTAHGGAPLVNTVAPVHTQSPGNGSGSLVNTSAPVGAGLPG